MGSKAPSNDGTRLWKTCNFAALTCTKPMNVIFRYSPDFSKVNGVYWEADNGMVKRKFLRSDGTVLEADVEEGTLSDIMNRVAGSHIAMYPAVVDDLRSAFQYLGKASDLVETLPEANIDRGNDSKST